MNWFGLFAPAGTSSEMVAYLNQAMNKVLQKPETANKLKSLGFEPKTSTPGQLAKVLSDDYIRWGVTEPPRV